MGTPTAIAELEWFASAADLCRAMDWLRVRGAAQGEGATALSVLGVNRGLAFQDKRWKYVGYKGARSRACST